jgi:hypothetical protein
MKIAAKPLLVLTFATTFIGGVTPLVQAGPMGPSAKMAASLKKRPTSAWLAHYLPDDRYKIAGGVWKFVSTDLDTYYHRPDSPLMLRQSADRVIGFSSVAEAEEAGYKPAPDAMGFGSMAGNGGGTSVSIISGTRILLSDQVSSIVLPRGWKKGTQSNQSIRGGNLIMDSFTGPNGQGLAVMSLKFPNINVDLGRVLNANTIKSQIGQFGALTQGSSVVDSRFSGEAFNKALKEMKVSNVRLGNMQGVLMTNTMKGRGSLNQYMFARGNKVMMIMDMSPNKKTTASIIRSIQLR